MILLKIIYLLITIIIIYMIYFIVSGVMIFSRKKEVSKSFIKDINIRNFYSEKIGNDKATIIEKPLEALKVRINLIKEAKNTINICYFSMDRGIATDIIFALLLKKANEGVKVKILLDGMFHGLVKENKAIIYSISKHPNIELKFYEPLNYLKPWTINNRMHDKYIIVDNKILLIGGRNIEDRFYFPKNIGFTTYDRDVLVTNICLNTKKVAIDKKSVIIDVSNYFEYIYNCKFSKEYLKKLTPKKLKLAEERNIELANKLKKYRDLYSEYFNDMQLYKIGCETNKITLVHNPIGRFKESWCLYDIVRILNKAKKSIFIQTPYLVVDRKMQKTYLKKKYNEKLYVNILTNSKASTPNLLAYSRYLKNRKKIAASGVTVYEYQSKDFIHAKTIAVDDDISIIGLFNMDPRSSFLSTETMLVIQSRKLRNQLDKIIASYEKESLTVGKDGNYLRGKVKEIKISKFKSIKIKLLYIIESGIEYLL
ncbi:phospholipase D-like domain-containing protein [Clostridium tarantellae]|uniref:PLD phosphodiesterase domain-containing protein n=1 Tax=Clostridium tarantellae TaxID=39493 RepID=A0A6I1MI13_9CLOT|nr:phosphatidylserine/phosphatidylglycerophosphate/cardiolipin synthase family protein [Clostridium tarantellae]MPQ42780.1 hypothetical protein [Clostridium tarantellae]